MDLPRNSANIIRIALRSIQPQHLTKHFNFDPKKLHSLIQDYFCTPKCISFSTRRNRVIWLHTSDVYKGNTLPNQILGRSFTGIMQGKKVVSSGGFCSKGCGTTGGKSRASSGSQVSRSTEPELCPLLDKTGRSYSWTFCGLLHCPNNPNSSCQRGEWMEWKELKCWCTKHN